MNNLKAKLKKQGGFTLIEMLIVVAIIAILIAIAVPMVNKALEKAREATDDANERAAIGLAYVDIMTDDSLLLASTNTAHVANYKIENNKGSLVASTDTPDPYGKGTKAGDVKIDRTASYIQVQYDTATGDVTAKWVNEDATP